MLVVMLLLLLMVVEVVVVVAGGGMFIDPSQDKYISRREKREKNIPRA